MAAEGQLGDAMVAADGVIRRILVVDDDPGIRRVLTYNLSAEGFEVDSVEDGHQVPGAIGSFGPDLLILDVMMPGRDGLDVLSDLRAQEGTRSIPVILLTAKATDEEVWAGWQAGADYYITKPFDLDEILSFVEYLSLQIV